MGSVVKEMDSHGPMVAAAEWWENAGRYDANGTAWGTRLELYRDGAVYSRRMLFHREQGRAFLRRRKAQSLDMALRQRASWQDFRDEWLAMQRNLGHEPVDVEQAKKDR